MNANVKYHIELKTQQRPAAASIRNPVTLALLWAAKTNPRNSSRSVPTGPSPRSKPSAYLWFLLLY